MVYRGHDCLFQKTSDQARWFLCIFGWKEIDWLFVLNSNQTDGYWVLNMWLELNSGLIIQWNLCSGMTFQPSTCYCDHYLTCEWKSKRISFPPILCIRSHEIIAMTIDCDTRPKTSFIHLFQFPNTNNRKTCLQK